MFEIRRVAVRAQTNVHLTSTPASSTCTQWQNRKEALQRDARGRFSEHSNMRNTSIFRSRLYPIISSIIRTASRNITYPVSATGPQAHPPLGLLPCSPSLSGSIRQSSPYLRRALEKSPNPARSLACSFPFWFPPFASHSWRSMALPQNATVAVFLGTPDPCYEWSCRVTCAPPLQR